MKVAVLYNEPAPGKADSMDVLDEVGVVCSCLAQLKYQFRKFPVKGGKSCHRILPALRKYSPDVVFNLVESIDEESRLHPAMAAFLELNGFAHTGARFETLAATTDKATAKAVLKANGLPTSDFQVYPRAHMRPLNKMAHGRPAGLKVQGRTIKLRLPVIVKPAWEDASVGINDGSVFHARRELESALPVIYKKLKQPLIIEEFIDGREVNVSMIEAPGGEAEIFPVSEMRFKDWPEGKPRILSYKAKWDEASFEYANTPRSFNTRGLPVAKIKEWALACWETFGLRGYARVDFRIEDGSQEPYIIEINCNPCLTRQCSFLTSAVRAGYGVPETIKRIIKAALASNGRHAS